MLSTNPDGAIVGQIPAGAFPRELHVTQDRRTLLLTNFNSATLELVDLTRLAAFNKKVEINSRHRPAPHDFRHTPNEPFPYFAPTRFGCTIPT